MTKILFLDIDGVLLPRRAYSLPNQTKPIVTVFDPCVVGMLNDLGKLDWQFVIHSSWLRSAFGVSYCDPAPVSVQEHMINQGLKEEYFHEDHSCRYKFSGTRWMAIATWLREHPHVKDYWILEDEPPPSYSGYKPYHDPKRVITTDFDEGLTFRQYARIAGIYSEVYGTEDPYAL